MTIINFPGGRKGRGDDGGRIERASALKGRLVEFVTRGPMRERHARAMREAGLDEPEFHEFVDFTDWFIFEWEDEDGARVLDEFLAANPDLDDEGRRLLEAWSDAIDDTFQVLEVAEDGVELRDGDGETYFAVPTNVKAAELGWRPKTLVQTRILPVGDVYILSGIQSFYSGPELDAMPDGVNLAALAGAGPVDEPGAGAFFVADVRGLDPEDRPEGSLAADAHAFLAETTASLKPETAEAHAVAVSLLAHYAAGRGLSRAEGLDADALLDFLAVWYPRVPVDRTLGTTRRLLGSVGKFAAWLDRRRGTTVGGEFKRRVLPALKEDLPRTLKAADEIDRLGPMFGISQMLYALAAEDPERGAAESRRGRFAVVSVDGASVTMRERPADPDAAAPLRTTELPGAAARLLRPGDVLEGVFFDAGDRLVVEAVECIYCPAAGV
jgi:hypothetical protein